MTSSLFVNEKTESLISVANIDSPNKSNREIDCLDNEP